ncbi:MAG: myo-inosose-2 dehydratase [Alphaproteobacteria bacterium]|nr:myo-inosose-2 dehydratase [Alphaproteobacteria bacterium]
MRVRLGTNPIAWSNDDLRTLGGETPLETCLAEARAAGFAGIELGHKFPREPGLLTRMLAAHDLALISGWYSSALLSRDVAAEAEALAPHLALLDALGAEVLILAETNGAIHGDPAKALSGRPRLSTEEMVRLAARLEALGRRVAGRGIRLAYHHHMGTVVQSEAEIDALMATTGPEVGLLLDTGHAAFAGADPARLAERHRDRILHVHCKDVRADVLARVRSDDVSFLDAVVAGVFTVPGEGAIDFAGVLGPLRRAGYSGWLVVEAEQDPAKADPATYARMGFQNLEAMAQRAGFRC